MSQISWLAKLAAAAPPQVFPLLGRGGREQLQQLRVQQELALTSSPRHAMLLLVVGALAPSQERAALLLHDQLPEPRGVLVWSDHPWTLALFPNAQCVAPAALPLTAAQALQRALLMGEEPSSPARLPGDNPVQWRGVGKHGQGGEGMMGGKPYGRAMAMKRPDLRDGLQLDALRFVLGPFLSYMPPGLELAIELQGDVIQQLRARVSDDAGGPDLPPLFRDAASRPVRVDALERARARHLLGACAELLWLHGLDGWAAQLLQLNARRDHDVAKELWALSGRLRRSSGLQLFTRGVGSLPATLLSGTGPIARAAGLRQDERSRDPAYRGLGFEIVTHACGDAEARFFQRLHEAAQAHELAARAGERVREPGPPLETPRGALQVTRERWSQLLSLLAAGSSWDSFVTTLVSLDLDAALLPSSSNYGDAHTGRAAEAEEHAC